MQGPVKEREVRVDPALIKLLASDTRRSVLRQLGNRRMTLTELAKVLDLKKATMLEHLKRLEDAELVTRKDDGRLWIYYELTPRARSLVDPVGTRIMIFLGITIAALIAGAVVALVLQPHLGLSEGVDDGFIGSGGDDADSSTLPGSLPLAVQDAEGVAGSPLSLHGAWMSDGNATGALRAYLLGAEEAERLRAGEAWVPALRLEPEPTSTGVNITGTAHLPAGQYLLYVHDAGGNDNRAIMPRITLQEPGSFALAQASHTTWWRGLDPAYSASLSADHEAAGGWLAMIPASGEEPLLVPFENGTASVAPEMLDAGPTGTYRLHHITPQGDTHALPQDLVILDAGIQILPPRLVEGSNLPIHLLFTAAGNERPGDVPVRVAGDPTPLERVSSGRGIVTLDDVQPGTLSVEVGRLHQQQLEVLPDLSVAATLQDGPQLRFQVTGADAQPRNGIQVRLDATLLGTTQGDGSLTVPAPLAQGAQTLTLRTSQGHEVAHGVKVEGWEIRPRFELLGLTAPSYDPASGELRLSASNQEARALEGIVVGTRGGQVVGATLIEMQAFGTLNVSIPLAEPLRTTSGYSAHAEGLPIRPLAFHNDTTPPPGAPTTPAPSEDETHTTFGIAIGAIPGVGTGAGGAFPTDPMDPADPVDPVDPADPVDPVDPVDPPTGPSDEDAEVDTPAPAFLFVLLMATTLALIARRRQRKRPGYQR